jgi:putative toxin-antitoxin system antitoxin component (TIGR02293 family)
VLFWAYVSAQELMLEAERIESIKAGASAQLCRAVGSVFGLEEHRLAQLLGSSPSTVKRRLRDGRPLAGAAAERLDRIADMVRLAEEIFGRRDAAVQWLIAPNMSLGAVAPLELCVTELGARQVRRLLIAIEWGGGG